MDSPQVVGGNIVVLFSRPISIPDVELDPIRAGLPEAPLLNVLPPDLLLSIWQNSGIQATCHDARLQVAGPAGTLRSIPRVFLKILACCGGLPIRAYGFNFDLRIPTPDPVSLLAQRFLRDPAEMWDSSEEPLIMLGLRFAVPKKFGTDQVTVDLRADPTQNLLVATINCHYERTSVPNEQELNAEFESAQKNVVELVQQLLGVA